MPESKYNDVRRNIFKFKYLLYVRRYNHQSVLLRSRFPFEAFDVWTSIILSPGNSILFIRSITFTYLPFYGFAEQEWFVDWLEPRLLALFIHFNIWDIAWNICGMRIAGHWNGCEKAIYYTLAHGGNTETTDWIWCWLTLFALKR